MIFLGGFVVFITIRIKEQKQFETIRDKEYTKSSVLLSYIRWKFMNFVPSSVKAEEWGITQRRVAILCNEGRVPGAELVGNRWFSPIDATKPEYPRRKGKEK